MADDPIVQMVGDPDFAKMPLSEQRKALTAHDPDFGGMGDEDLTKFVSAHQGIEIPDAAAQAHQQMQRAIPTMAQEATERPTGRSEFDPSFSAFTQSGQRKAALADRYNNYMQQSGQTAGTMAG